METGRIGDYVWCDLGEMPMRESLRRLAPWIAGLKAINTSFDSGLLSPGGRGFPEGWTAHQGVAVSPAITSEMLENWPLSHDEYCDEWWFFKEIPADFAVTHGICSYIENHIREWAELEFDGGAQLWRNIARFRPEMIVGNNRLTYCVSKRRIPVAVQPRVC